MKNRLFPEGFIGLSIESYTFRIKPRSKAIYLTLLTFLLVSMILLPFVKIEVSRSVRGQVSSSEDRHFISSPVSARVTYSHLKEDQQVFEGDTLLRFDHEVLKIELFQQNSDAKELGLFLTDLEGLLNDSSVNLKTDRFKSELLEFTSSLKKLEITRNNLRKQFIRQQKLFDAEVISELQYEEAKLPFDQINAEIAILKESQRSKWEMALLELERRLSSVKNRINQLKEEIDNRCVIAPASGSLQNVLVVKEGQFLHSGTKLAEVSPGDSLVISCLVAPWDIGLLRVNQSATFRVDAFNYNEWGMLEGQIKQISSDVYMQDGHPFFLVKCSLVKDFLSLGNGFEGKLKKGMTVQANFIVAERSLYRLLYDHVDNWVNPMNRPNNIASKSPK
ncbi:HlyD family secretion protein [Marinoscillum furvescens]|uniref:Multidrug resistance efflux pump n=1 Tax=Marinoscillum furvescens DSM 4134 TaxID=1122208 RepID=A0A3D9KXZ0_MARFU|nr:HlyD family efflux transporter periplasmic adaptor subunit [Marinoscillum furvescens]RED92069.1 multidrug resistance efflux pump [Marinoscillum furvescens DSM 4134]